MTAATDKKKIAAFLKKHKTAELQALLKKDDLDETGAVPALRARILEAAKICDIDFATEELDNLTYLQVFGKCMVEDWPVDGTREEMQEMIAHGSGSGFEAEDEDLVYLRDNCLRGRMLWQLQ